MRAPLVIVALASVLAGRAAAQDRPALDVQATFFADNTEFSNPFREGQTALGAFGRVAVEIPVGRQAAIHAGIFGLQEFGSDEAFDEVRPVLALVVGGERSRFVFGTLETVRRNDGAGPDRFGLHGLLPPLQRETLAFERPWEAGLQWIVDTPRLRQDVWVNWQRSESPFGRERFDAGAISRVQTTPSIAIQGQVHVVHEGGQRFAAGVVRDSAAGAVGIIAGGPAGPFARVELDSHLLVSRDVPDRASIGRARNGIGIFLRLAGERRGWRGHALVARSNDFIKEEGDRHYQSLRRDGTEFRALRDYAEAGLTREFRLDDRSALEASVRWHRVENDYEYSYRILAVFRQRWLLRGP